MTDLPLERRLTQLREMASRYAAAKGDAVKLDEYRKSKLAMLQKKYAAEGFDSVAAQEREARADPEYLAVLDGLAEAVRVSEELGWHLRIAMKGADLWQTLQANERAEIKAYGKS